jgi:hypothetical protein
MKTKFLQFDIIPVEKETFPVPETEKIIGAQRFWCISEAKQAILHFLKFPAALSF